MMYKSIASVQPCLIPLSKTTGLPNVPLSITRASEVSYSVCTHRMVAGGKPKATIALYRNPLSTRSYALGLLTNGKLTTCNYAVEELHQVSNYERREYLIELVGDAAHTRAFRFRQPTDNMHNFICCKRRFKFLTLIN